MTLKIPCSNISQALAELQPGESLLIPCNGKTIQVTVQHYVDAQKTETGNGRILPEKNASNTG